MSGTIMDLHANELEFVLLHLSLKDLHSAKGVCKEWKRVIENSSLIWNEQFEKHRLYRVMDTIPRNLHDDFKAIYSNSITVEDIEKIFGKVIGDIPHIDKKIFEMFISQKDPYEKEKSMLGNYFFVMMPAAIEFPMPAISSSSSSSSVNEANDKRQIYRHELDKYISSSSSSSIEANENQDEVKEVPLTERNICIISQKNKQYRERENKNEHLFDGRGIVTENTAVATIVHDLPPGVSVMREGFSGTEHPVDKNYLVLIRKNVLNQSKRLIFSKQVEVVEKEGQFKISNLRTNLVAQIVFRFNSIVTRPHPCGESLINTTDEFIVTSKDFVRPNEHSSSKWTILRPQLPNFKGGFSSLKGDLVVSSHIEKDRTWPAAQCGVIPLIDAGVEKIEGKEEVKENVL